jgi:hypothetical protein
MSVCYAVNELYMRTHHCLYAQTTLQHAYQTETPLIVFKADIQKEFDTIS